MTKTNFMLVCLRGACQQVIDVCRAAEIDGLASAAPFLEEGDAMGKLHLTDKNMNSVRLTLALTRLMGTVRFMVRKGVLPLSYTTSVEQELICDRLQRELSSHQRAGHVER